MKLGKLFSILPILIFVAIMIGASVKSPMVIDEYCFYKLSLNFPDYSSTPQWFFKDRPEVLTQSIDWEEADKDRDRLFDLVYLTPIYTHTPLMPMIMSPIVKGLNYIADKGIIPHVEDEPGLLGTSDEDVANSKAEVITIILRMLTISIVAVSMWLMHKIAEHKFNTNIWMFGVPIATGLMMLTGVYLFYWDVFMMFFFVLTLYLMEVKPNSKWKYVTACCLVNTKMFVGIMFLGMLVVKAIKDNWRTSWKMMLPALSILPFYIATVIVTGDYLYVFIHYLRQAPIHNLIYTLNSPFQYFMIILGLGIPELLLLTVPALWWWKKYPEYVILWIFTMIYAWGTGLGITHTSTLIYTGALTFPIVAYKLKLMERLENFMKPKKKVEA